MKNEELRYEIWYYIMYGNPKEVLGTLEDIMKGFEEFAEALKKVGLEMVFYGFPFGTTENGMCALKGEFAGFERIWNNPEVGGISPLTDVRTNLILVP